ncbi:MAG TPA: VOC family protein [Nocardioides sp.]|uniref:VOC family protein n=1 Tax=Nocardioides sp. TaxID=35761 RepID=UPI002C887271|nr:VOC family protein [Nocardioides sp.]HQR28713.1 VOC family protein [Nocardioides sp.]
MITALHSLVYAEDPEAARAFFRDVLLLPHVDTGGGWLIFKTGPSELGVHPSRWEHEGQRGGTDQRYDVSLVCDDLAATMAELAGRGATFAGAPVQQEWGTTVDLVVPGARPIMLYQPRYDPPALLP